MAHLGENISKLRGLRRLTQKDMASRLNVAQPVYSKIEQKAEIDDDLLSRIASVLEVSPEAIKNFSEGAVINIISSTLTLNDNASSFNSYPTYNFNPVDKLVELVEENKKLYERLLAAKDESLNAKDKVITMYKSQQTPL
jgi:transcriptional regulator with XRE-family HTH domain